MVERLLDVWSQPRGDELLDEPLSQRRVCCKDLGENRDGEEQEREHAEEPVVGQQGGELGPLVVQVLPQHRVRKAEHAVAALDGVESAQHVMPAPASPITYAPCGMIPTPARGGTVDGASGTIGTIRRGDARMGGSRMCSHGR